MREKAVSQSVPVPFQHQQPQRSTSISAGDYFHDGCRVLDVVTDWHKVLRNALRNTDTVTSGLLDIVDHKMLLGSANSRIKAKDLCSELKNIIAQSEAAPRIKMPRNIMETLLEADRDAVSSEPLGSESKPSEHLAGPDNRKARKSKLLEQPLIKTAHRSEGLKSVLASHHWQPAGRDRPTTKVAVQTGPSEQTRHGPSGVAPAHNRSPKVQLNAGISSHARTPIMPEVGQPAFPSQQSKKPTRTPKTHTPQDIFQAQEEIKARDKRDKHNIFGNQRKDKLLAKHFGNRDLV